jgi:NADP-dependent 3-hydroxy acid dehydrogenase YdfG
MSYDFNKKVVWLTGASSGIGLALAKQLISAKCNLIVTSRNEDKLNQLFSDYSNVLVAAGDVTLQQTNDNIVETIIARYGRLDCVILNAGNAEYVDIKNFSTDVFKRMMDINYLSMIKGIEVALPHLRQSSAPYLVGMSSSAAWHGLPQGQAYSASKAAIRNLFQGLKIQLSPENIDVSWICPGFVETPLTDKNTFPMPARITAQKAGEVLYKKLCKQTAEIHFPKRFTFVLKFISMLPAAWAARLLQTTIPKDEVVTETTTPKQQT